MRLEIKLRIGIIGLLTAFGVASYGSTNVEVMVSQNVDTAKTDNQMKEEKLITDWWSSSMGFNALPLERLSFPIAYHDNGLVRAKFKAEKVFLPKDENDSVRAYDMRIQLFDEDGGIAGYYSATNCIFDRNDGIGFCEGHVTIYYRAPYKNIVIYGTNMLWNVTERSAKVLVNPAVTFSTNSFLKELNGAFR